MLCKGQTQTPLRNTAWQHSLQSAALRLGSAAQAVRTGSVTPKAPAFWGPKKRPMILALWPPVRAIPIGARERYDNVLTRVPVRDGRGVTRFVRSRANQRRDRECKNSLPHDVPAFLLILFRRPGSFSLSALPSSDSFHSLNGSENIDYIEELKLVAWGHGSPDEGRAPSFASLRLRCSMVEPRKSSPSSSIRSNAISTASLPWRCRRMRSNTARPFASVTMASASRRNELAGSALLPPPPTETWT